jgi:hypothetical protein
MLRWIANWAVRNAPTSEKQATERVNEFAAPGGLLLVRKHQVVLRGWVASFLVD